MDTIALVTALCVIPMYPNGNPNRIILVVSLVIGGFIFFGILSKLGERYLNLIHVKAEKLKDLIPSSVCANTNGKAPQFENNIKEDNVLRKLSHKVLRKLSLGARAARKV